MRTRSLTLAACLGLVAGPLLAQADAKSLYQRLGGRAAIEAVVKDFTGRALADARIKQKFAKSKADRLEASLVQQICAATGGPCKYTGRSMKESHRDMGVTDGEFAALVSDLTASLDHFKVGAKEKSELLGALGAMKSDIVEVKGNATGTPLPPNFVAWRKAPG